MLDFPIADEGEVLAFDGLHLKDPSDDAIEALELETRLTRRMIPPRFVVDLSDKAHNLPVPKHQTIHGSYLVRRSDVLLFGSSNVVSRDGHWNCENRDGKRVYLAYMEKPFFGKLFPGDTPTLHDIHTSPWISTEELAAKRTVRRIDDPIFLGTPLEPPTWGRWVASVMPRVKHFLRHGEGRKFLCHAAFPWERRILNTLGIPDERIIPHEPGCTYLCRDVMLVESAGQGVALSLSERAMMNDIVTHNRVETSFGKRLFVSRVATTKKNPNYRPLLNEAEVIEFVSEKGFSIIEPDLLPFSEQVSAFRNAEMLIFVGGSAIYNAAFCLPGTRVVTMESSMTFVPTHMDYLSALDIEYGVVFGQEDPSDDRLHHRRWSLDIAPAWEAIEAMATSD